MKPNMYTLYKKLMISMKFQNLYIDKPTKDNGILNKVFPNFAGKIHPYPLRYKRQDRWL